MSQTENGNAFLRTATVENVSPQLIELKMPMSRKACTIHGNAPCICLGFLACDDHIYCTLDGWNPHYSLTFAEKSPRRISLSHWDVQGPSIISS